jgi:hypothetical protein
VSSHQTSIDHPCTKPNSLPGQLRLSFTGHCLMLYLGIHVPGNSTGSTTPCLPPFSCSCNQGHPQAHSKLMFSSIGIATCTLSSITVSSKYFSPPPPLPPSLPPACLYQSFPAASHREGA